MSENDLAGEIRQLATKVDVILDGHIDLQKSALAMQNAIAELAKSRQGASATVTHVHQGAGTWGVAAIVACFATWILVILGAMEIHDLRAWRDIHQNHISALEAKGKSP